MKIDNSYLFVCVLAVAACAGSSSEDRLDVRSTDTTLHVTRIEDGATTGRLTLELGPVQVEQDSYPMGRQLVITAGRDRFEHTSGGLADLALPYPEQDLDVLAFLQDARIAKVLAEHHIAFDYQARLGTDLGEGAYEACTYSGCAQTGTLDCCAVGGGSTIEYRCCNSGSGAIRDCTGPGTCVNGAGTYPNCTEGATCPAGSAQCANGSNFACCNSCGIAGAVGCSVCAPISWSWACYVTNSMGGCGPATDCYPLGSPECEYDVCCE